MSVKKIAIIQSNYIPWKGYFDIINEVDHFVLYDDVQFNHDNWRNRNKIKTPQGTLWMTIPVEQKSLSQKIQDTVIADSYWKKRHFKTLCQNYGRAEYFREYKEFFEELYLNTNEKYLTLVNYRFLKAICNLLNINTEFSFSRDYTLCEGKMERVVDLTEQLDGDIFVCAPILGERVIQFIEYFFTAINRYHNRIFYLTAQSELRDIDSLEVSI